MHSLKVTVHEEWPHHYELLTKQHILGAGYVGYPAHLFRKRKSDREDAGPHMPLGSSPQAL